MLAAVDIGNTNIVIGLYDGDHLASQFRLATHATTPADEYAALLESTLRLSGMRFADITGLALGSVVPDLTPVFEDIGRRFLQCPMVTITAETPTGIEVAYHPPADVGSDRILNAVAARQRHRGNLIIVDFGTATTLDVVTADDRYIGGVIVPGIAMGLDVLARRTARLPRVPPARPTQVIGQTTRDAIQSGGFWGHIATIEGIVARIRAELAGPVRVLATGGLAPVLAPDCRVIDDVCPDLTLEGLKLVWDHQSGSLPVAGKGERSCGS